MSGANLRRFQVPVFLSLSLGYILSINSAFHNVFFFKRSFCEDHCVLVTQMISLQKTALRVDTSEVYFNIQRLSDIARDLVHFKHFY